MAVLDVSISISQKTNLREVQFIYSGHVTHFKWLSCQQIHFWGSGSSPSLCWGRANSRGGGQASGHTGARLQGSTLRSSIYKLCSLRQVIQSLLWNPEFRIWVLSRRKQASVVLEQERVECKTIQWPWEWKLYSHFHHQSQGGLSARFPSCC